MELLSDLSVPLDRVEVHKHTQMKNVIGVVAGFLTPAAGRGADPRQVAVQFTRANGALVSGDYVVQALRPTRRQEAQAVVTPREVTRSPAGYHVQLQQTYQGVPVYGGRAVVHMTREGGVYFYTSDLQPDIPQTEIEKAGELSAYEALEALERMSPWKSRSTRQPDCSRVYFPGEGGTLHPSWRIDLGLAPVLPIASPGERSSDLEAIVDAVSGQVLQVLDLTFYNPSWAYVFSPNPVVSTRREGLTWDAHVPDSAYRRVRLAQLDDTGYLSGTYANTAATPNRAHEPGGQFLYRRGEPRFLEVMAYGFVSRVMNWLARQGWGSLFPRPIGINASASIGDNSKFLPTSWELSFGAGRVMDAEDASIIVHELGHAIQEAQVKGWGNCQKHKPVRAMGEGFADWLATIYFAAERRSFHPTLVGDWDARGYEPPDAYLRRVDTPKTMNDWTGDEHSDGEIWSAALWDLYLHLGGESQSAKARRDARETAVKLVLTSHLYLSDGRRDTLTYQHGLAALLDADRFTSTDVTQPGPHDQLIRDAFAARGIVS